MPGRSLRAAGRPRPAAARSACRSSRTPRTRPSRATAAARSARSPTLTCFSLYATKNIAAGEGGLIATNDDDLAEAARRPARHAPRPRLALRHRRAGLQGEPLATCSRRSRSCQLDKVERHARDPRAARRALRRGRRRARRHRRRSPATRATCTRTTCTSSASTPSVPARRATSSSARSTDENIGTSIHFLPVHQLTRLPRAARTEPAAAAGRGAGRRRGALAAALAGALGRRRQRRDRRAAARARALRRMKPLRSALAATLVVTGARGRLHPLEDRPRQDVRHPRRREHPAWLALSAFLTLVTVPPMAWRWQLLLARARRPRRPRLADPRVLRLLRGRPGAADRRSAATRRGSTRRRRRHPGQTARRSRARCCSSARSAARSRSCSPAIGLRCSRSAATRSAPYLWVEALFVVGDDRRRRSSFFSRTVRGRLAFAACRSLRRLRVERTARAVYEGIHGYRDHAGTLARRRAAITAVAQLARDPRDLGRRPRGRDRALAAAVRRARAAALPRHARAVHDQRARRARGVLRQLPRQARRRAPTTRSRPASSSS